MYHLLVASKSDTWRGRSVTMPLSRCLNSGECTARHLLDAYCQFTPEQNSLLTQLPAIFGYETIVGQDARIGRIVRITRDVGSVTIDFQLLDSYPPLSNDVLQNLELELGLEHIDLHRGHWALKDVDLGEVLSHAGYPPIPFANQPLVNIRQHCFEVALSFPGEVRQFIETVAKQLVRVLGPNTVFYDNFYKSQLASPNLDTSLQELYGHRSKLVVVFLSEDYAGKKWCGIEFCAIREIINLKRDDMVMYVRFDNANVQGVFTHDGYIDATTHTEIEVAMMIQERVLLQRLSTIRRKLE